MLIVVLYPEVAAQLQQQVKRSAFLTSYLKLNLLKILQGKEVYNGKIEVP